jgi:hypothetical protein
MEEKIDLVQGPRRLGEGPREQPSAEGPRVPDALAHAAEKRDPHFRP